MNNRKTLLGLTAATLLTVSLSASFSANAISIPSTTVIASTDFDGRTVNGATAENLTWITNGIANLGDLTAFPVGGSTPTSFGLFDTTDTQDLFAVDRNINDEGDWAVDINVSVLSNTINLSTVNFDALIFNNNGQDQPVQRLLNVNLDIFDSSQSSLFSESIFSVFDTNGAFVNGNSESLSFDVSSVMLGAGLDYTFRITAFGDLKANGNNAGIDNLVISGNLVNASAPTMLSLLMLGGISLIARRKAV